MKNFDDLNLYLVDKISTARPQDKDFHTYLSNLFNDFKNKLESIDRSIFINNLPNKYTKGDVINIVKNKSKRLLSIFTYYSQGRFATAIKAMENLIFDVNHPYRMLELEENEEWFRARTLEKDNRQYSSDEMFHMPFEKRHLIKNYRYSISGYPCLYIGKTIMACWEEMKKPSLYDFCVAKLVTRDKIKVLDLTLPEKNNVIQPLFGGKSDEEKRNDLYLLLATWPIIIACSIPTAFPNSPFKPEYVIPQLLMQVIQSKNKSIYGVAYTSTRRDITLDPELSTHLNIALPARNVKKMGHCPDLKSKFEITRGVPYMEAEIKNCFHKEKSYTLNEYEKTKFYQLEHFLNNI